MAASPNVLVLSLDGAGVIAWDGADLEVAPRRRAALVPVAEDGGARIVVKAPFEQLSLRLDHLPRQLEVLLGARVLAPLRFAPQVRLDEAPGSDLLHLIDLIVQAYPRDRGALGAPPVLGGLVEALGTALLLCQPHGYTAHLGRAAQPAPPREVRLAQAYLDLHFAEAVRMKDVAQAAGVSLRSLQGAFQAHCGTSLSAALAERRLEHARRLLGEPQGATVAQVALDCGIGHLGRFSAAYRRRFGEGPSETLRRARRDRGPRGDGRGGA